MSLAELVGGQDRSGRPNIAAGKVVKAPASTADAMAVVLKNFSSRFEYEVPAGNWKQAGALPARDDRCLVAFDDDGDAWVLAYGGA